MTNKAWQLIKVLDSVYCNSSGDLFFEFVLAINGKRHRVSLDTSGYTRTDYRQREGYGIVSLDPPKYMQREIEAVIAEKIDNADFMVYEVDREGNKRFEGLRYHEPDDLKWWRNQILVSEGE